MISAFLDASVLFAAAYSDTGASREIIRQAIRGQIHLVTSRLAFEEATRNLQAKAPQAAADLDRFWDSVAFEVVRPTRQEIEAAMQYIAAKDAALVAAARRAQVDYLVSLDRRHLVGLPEVARQSGLKIVLPQEFLKEVRRRTGSS